MDLGLDGRVFVVTGGSRGLGRAAAEALVAEGARVVVTARDDTVLSATVAALGGPEHAVGLADDVADPRAAERVVAAAIARYGRLDGALLSVGGPAPGTPTGTTDTAWRESFETVFLGPLRVARACASALVTDPEQRAGTGGSVVFVLSTTVREPIDGLTVSNGLRPALAGVAKDLADELAPRGIRVNAILPGRIATDRTLSLDAANGPAEVVRRRRESTIPLGRYGDPAEFAAVAAFLLSPTASYITGSMIPVDGGSLRGW